MAHCIQSTITDKAFEHLAGLHTLNMMGCDQSTITNRAVQHLSGLHTLDMTYCYQNTITNGVCAHLSKVSTVRAPDRLRLLRVCEGAILTKPDDTTAPLSPPPKV